MGQKWLGPVQQRSGLSQTSVKSTNRGLEEGPRGLFKASVGSSAEVAVFGSRLKPRHPTKQWFRGRSCLFGALGAKNGY